MFRLGPFHLAPGGSRRTRYAETAREREINYLYILLVDSISCFQNRLVIEAGNVEPKKRISGDRPIRIPKQFILYDIKWAHC